ncbi:nucleotide exchange factor GrpE [Mycoplasma hyopneumoniae]|uniref:nucleotide exchange factor GrpE n=1 Tax=Mesomycoplasma hyopneumoniae TaxID=2099 RepID=UPI00136DD0DA|nr:nucleotide exchange factor GrpE [Mesomycoplasma hyopneumoniae]MXR10924.1 nucleotide exchange factor GrpE [Mesomycoplasma hyopneumoniae]MXR63820.1 nucleotide exchange factor GrpE [Mesomycoplasma hyopneumoniae]
MVFGAKKLQEFENNLQNLSSDNDLEDKKVINPDEKQELEIDKEVEKTEKTEKKTRRFLKKEAKLKDLENQIQNLTTRNITLEIEAIKLKDKIKKLEEDFKSQVKTFEEKATQKVKELKLDLQKKLENEQDLLKKYSLQPFFEDFSSPFLNLKKAISYGLISQNPEISAYVKGFEMLVNQIENVMENFGLVKIYPKIGDFFDSSVHEIYEIKTGENDKIFEVVSEGYKLHDRIVKTALVVVGKPNEEKN